VFCVFCDGLNLHSHFFAGLAGRVKLLLPHGFVKEANNLLLAGRVKLLLPHGFVKEANNLLLAGRVKLLLPHGFVKEANNLLSALSAFHSQFGKKQFLCLF
jgi:hypothetical protein